LDLIYELSFFYLPHIYFHVTKYWLTIMLQLTPSWIFRWCRFIQWKSGGVHPVQEDVWLKYSCLLDRHLSKKV